MCNTTDLISHLEKRNMSSMSVTLDIQPNLPLNLTKERWYELKRVIDTVSRITEIRLHIESLEITLEGKEELLREKSTIVNCETLLSVDTFPNWLRRLLDDVCEKP